MRLWIMLAVGALMLAVTALPSPAWSATMDDVTTEMAEKGRPFWGEQPVLYVPMAVAGTAHMPMSSLCVSGGRLRPIGEGATVTDMGPAPHDNQYSVQIHSRDGGGYDLFLYERKVPLPDCQ